MANQGIVIIQYLFMACIQLTRSENMKQLLCKCQALELIKDFRCHLTQTLHKSLHFFLPISNQKGLYRKVHDDEKATKLLDLHIFR